MREVKSGKQQGNNPLLFAHEIVEMQSGWSAEREYTWIGKMAYGARGRQRR